ncbi:PfkB family carbohydrate kinase [Mycobacterium sp. 1423905.2]|uniref:PfkB family carbohydrate kinase n=1 Tax=Mycobacterium sp. 1423905.2 TaxID=1856859 RepID=UPI0007FDB354|nr:PfkB family carbohydrate kinase [Mycobacterium sp. 1423905.2]OBJ56447.1 ribokinase [Mycobacterium sp. 1423905.2]
MATRVCVVGSVNIDLTFEVTQLPRPGETVLATSLTHAPGGKGANQAVAAARAGAAVQFVGAFGGDAAAQSLRGHLQTNGVGLDGAVTVTGPSGTAVILVDADAENTIVVAPGANAELHVTSSTVSDCDVLLTQLEITVPAALTAARAARAAGAAVMVNASPAGQDPTALAQLAAVADVVIANEAEARQWLWRSPHFVTTLGARGARYTGVDGEFTVPAPTVTAVDTTGAGDVFAGVLAAHWPPHPGSPEQRKRAVRRACVAGALATLVAGAGDCAPDAAAIDAAL